MIPARALHADELILMSPISAHHPVTLSVSSSVALLTMVSIPCSCSKALIWDTSANSLAARESSAERRASIDR